MIDEEFIPGIRKKIKSKFSNLEFVDSSHQYFLKGKDGTKVEYMPVTNIIGKWAIPFDTDGNAERYAMKNGMSKEDVLNKWKYVNLVATTTGTLVHAFAESYGWLKNGFPQNINDETKYQFDKETGWLIPTRPKEIAVKAFWDELDPTLKFVGAEFKMCSQYLDIETNMAGTFDLLLYYDNPDPNGKSGFVLCDYKTNRDLFSEYNEEHQKMMFPPFDDMFDENFGHYTLQFAAYQLMLESIGIPIIGRRLIWLKDDESYEIIRIKDKTKELKNVL